MNENEIMNDEVMTEEEQEQVETTELDIPDAYYPATTDEVSSDSESSSGLTVGEIAGIGALIAGGIYLGKKFGVPAVKKIKAKFDDRAAEKLRKKAAKRGWTIVEPVETPATDTTEVKAEEVKDVPEEQLAPAEEAEKTEK